MFVGLIAIFVIPDMPSHARGFSKEETALVMYRMIEDVSTAKSKVSSLAYNHKEHNKSCTTPRIYNTDSSSILMFSLPLSSLLFPM